MVCWQKWQSRMWVPIPLTPVHEERSGLCPGMEVGMGTGGPGVCYLNLGLGR